MGSKVFNPDGTEFRFRGADVCHYDSNWQNGVTAFNVNCVRIFMPTDAARMAGYIQAAQAKKVMPIATMANFPGGGQTNNNPTAAALATGVAWWVSNAPALKDIHPWVLNIANEWLQGTNSALWQASYIDAVTKLRAAGYTQLIMIDTDAYGQGYSTLLNGAAQAVFNADPLKNVCFGYHLYGQTPDNATMVANFNKLGSLGFPVVIAEFGPGRNIGPSPTMITPTQVINAAEGAGLGWIAWAIDDNNLANAKADDNWFSLTNGNTGGVGYFDGNTAELTKFGNEVLPLLKSLAVKSTLFK